MVTRKPVGPPPIETSSNKQASVSAFPPYPSTPPPQFDESNEKTGSNGRETEVYSPDLRKSPAFDLIDMHEAQRQRTRSDSDASSHGTWDSDEEDDKERAKANEADIPKPLSIRSSPKGNAGHDEEGLPAILRPGPPEESKQQRRSMDAQRYDEEASGNPWAEVPKPPDLSSSAWQQPSTNNPYHMRNNVGVESSQSAWSDTLPSRDPPPVPTSAPPPPPPPPQNDPPPLPQTDTTDSSNAPMSFDEQRRASWETAERFSVPQRGQSPFPPVVSPPATSRPVSRWWETSSEHTNSDSKASPPPSFPPPAVPPQLPVVEESEYQPPPLPSSQPPNAFESDHKPLPGSSSGMPSGSSGLLIDHESDPRGSDMSKPTIQATPPPVASSSQDAVPETPRTQLRRQRNEHYQIKHVNWFDESCTSDPSMRSGMRRSPILTQNANGPCPLLALVNALILSTPHDLDTALIETLKTREQVSLGLLLDAVFDELMSGRRGDTAHDLPDVSELYSFLLALHTGMNVNPRFVTPSRTPRGSFDGHPAALNSIHPVHRAQSKAGAFEETREMRLYSTFNIPLIHGWTPAADTPAYEAFLRSAQTFEDAQNIQFAEMELTDKMAAEGLSAQESQMFEDIQTIKEFLNAWPTQLTEYGLETISRNLQPGQVAILFRNDHFSTVYKETRHGALMTLVTDAGYESHDEIIWESLVDVNGSASELFSGDFRVVSHNQSDRLNQDNSGGGNEGWETVQSRNRHRNNRPSNGSRISDEPAPPPLPGPRPPSYRSDISANAPPATDQGSQQQISASEQEDHDLALALQLQEEEEDRQRQADERRRREQELSEQFLANEPEGPRPQVPPRRATNAGSNSNNNNNNNNNPRHSRRINSTNNARVASSSSTNNNAPSTPSRPAVPARPAVTRPVDPDDPDAPPSYEQAASDRLYRPAGSTAPASLSQGNPLGAYDALRRQQSAYTQQSTSTLGGGGGGGGGGPGTPPEYSGGAGGGRRRSDGNRLQRRDSRFGGPGAYPGGGNGSPYGGGGGGSGPAFGPNAGGQQQMRVSQAAGLNQVDDGRCAVM